jgi:phage shock protein A
VIVGKFWQALRAQLNKLANFFWTADPIAQMQYEYDQAVEQLRQGREGLEQHRAFVERLGRQVAEDRVRVAHLEAKVKALLGAGERDAAGRFALELQRTRQGLADNEAQLELHEQAYEHNVTRIKHAGAKLAQLREKIARYDAELKMSHAEAEMARLAQDFHFDTTTDFGRIEQVIRDKISLNRAKVRVAADLSGEGLADVRTEQAVEGHLAEQALLDFEARQGLRAAEPPKLLGSPRESQPKPVERRVPREG